LRLTYPSRHHRRHPGPSSPARVLGDGVHVQL
jgi:hypothetical protein